MAQKKPIECKSDIGITIGLIDAIITTARVVRKRLDIDAMISGSVGDKHQPVRDALTDLCCCQELNDLIGRHDTEAMRIIHDAAALLNAKP